MRQRRQAIGLTLREFCRRNGYDAGNLSKLERGLARPPEGRNSLESLAKALKLESDPGLWMQFMDLASAATGRIPEDMQTNPMIREAMPGVFQKLRRPTSFFPIVRSADLEGWADRLDARSVLPQLIRRLVHGIIEPEDLKHIDFPANDASQRPDWDGKVVTSKGKAWIPGGASGWEMGTGADPGQKAEDDYRNRSKDPSGLNPSECTFVFVTPREWRSKNDWCEKKKRLGPWKDVKAYDSSDLEQWLETAHAVDEWCARLIGKDPGGIRSIDDHWANVSILSSPPLKPAVFLTSRAKQVESLKKWLEGSPSLLEFTTHSPSEVVDFFAAYVASLDDKERAAIGARIVIVEKREAWDALCVSQNRLILVPSPRMAIEPEMLADAVRCGHRVLAWRYYANGKTSEPDKELSRVFPFELEKFLRESGFEEEEAARLAGKCGGSLTALKRLVGRFPETELPKWAQKPVPAEIAAILLAGRWDDENAADREALEKLAGCPYNKIQYTANQWVTGEDPLLIRALSHWRLTSREDSWALLSQYIAGQQLDIFAEIAIDVLGEKDSGFDLPSEDRWLASIKGKMLRYSSQLREGIADAVALLGVNPEWTGRADRIVGSLLSAITDWKQYASLDDVLPQLAEAAPDVFLDIMKKKVPCIAGVFSQKDSGLFSASPYTGLLWALETLAWEPKHLDWASRLLAQLAKMNTSVQNGPIDSLTRIFLPWFPQTSASVETRIKVLEHLCKIEPDVTWCLLLTLLPSATTMAFPTSRPEWRDWALNRPKVTNRDRWEVENATADLLIEMAGHNADRWTDLIGHLHHFYTPALDRLLEKLANDDLNKLASRDRNRIADKLREVLNRHRSYPNAEWVLPAHALERIEEVLRKFEPEDPISRYKWLFVEAPEVVDVEENTWEQREEIIFGLRQGALSEILKNGNFKDILALVGATQSPEDVGRVLGKAKLLSKDEDVIPGCLASDNANVVRFTQSYIRERFEELSWAWLGKLPLHEWSAVQASRFLLSIPSDRRAWVLVDQLGAKVVQLYWSQTNHTGRRLSTNDVEYAVSMLLKYNRPFMAVDVVRWALRNQRPIKPEVVMDVLDAGVETTGQSSADLSLNQVYHHIQKLFGYLQSLAAIDAERLAKLEWKYLALLDGRHARPATLHRYLSDNPDYFADFLKRLYPSRKSVSEVGRKLTEEDKSWIQNGYRLLMSWETIPGLQSGETTKDEQLMSWVKKARTLCEESGHLEVCDVKIGELLAKWPDVSKDSDGGWPGVAVRDVIEAIESEDLEHGFEVGTLNKLGVVVKSMVEGGQKENSQASLYSKYADICNVEWPRTAAALRRVAKAYEHMARRADEEVRDRF